jgi:hypothetical protein
MSLMHLEKDQFITNGKLSMVTLQFLNKKTIQYMTTDYHLKIIDSIIIELSKMNFKAKKKRNKKVFYFYRILSLIKKY